MKRIAARLSAVIVYIAILLYAADFRFSLLWDPQNILFVLTGTLLFTLSSYRRGSGREDLYYNIRFHAMSAAYLTTFIGLYTNFASGKVPLDEVVPTIAISCRPLLYGFILYLLSETNPKAASGEEPDADENTLKSSLREAGLTKREIEVTLLVRQGLTNKEIGDTLYISDTTVKKHISNIFEKLHLINREQLRNFKF